MPRHPETNPHFVRPHQQREGQLPQTPLPRGTPTARHEGQGQYHQQDWDNGQFDPQWSPPLKPPDQGPDPSVRQPPPKRRQRQDRRPRGILPPQKSENQDGRPRAPRFEEHDRRPPRRHSPEVIPSPQSRTPRVPPPRPTRAITWFGGIFCAIFSIVVFLGGLIVLIVYLVYRPHSPWFNVSSATLNAAYIDAGSLLNADLSLLVNFTNPNKKMNVDFSSMIIDLYYGNTLISTQYIEPFSAARLTSRFVNVRMVSSQVRLPLKYSQLLQEQINRNEIIFQVEGVFRVRSKLGSLLRYSYWLHAHCSIMVTNPPTGVLRATKCRTKKPF